MRHRSRRAPRVEVRSVCCPIGTTHCYDTELHQLDHCIDHRHERPGPTMTAILALSAAVVYGTADFCGGIAARRTSPLAVTFFAHVVGLVLLVLTLPVLPVAHPQPADLLYGGAAGALGAGGLILFYRALSRGTMSVIAPVAALF